MEKIELTGAPLPTDPLIVPPALEIPPLVDDKPLLLLFVPDPTANEDKELAGKPAGLLKGGLRMAVKIVPSTVP